MCPYILLSTTYPPNTHRHTHSPLLVSPHRREGLRGRGEGGMLMKSGTGPRNVIRPPHLQERRNRPPNFTMMMSACLHDSVWLRCQVSPLSLCFFFFFLFPSLPLFFFLLSFLLSVLFFYRSPFLFSFFCFCHFSF